MFHLQVPDTDIFDTPQLPVLCDSDNCKNFEKQGCYLALLQRKVKFQEDTFTLLFYIVGN